MRRITHLRYTVNDRNPNYNRRPFTIRDRADIQIIEDVSAGERTSLRCRRRVRTNALVIHDCVASEGNTAQVRLEPGN